jgi:hypothetical protein
MGDSSAPLQNQRTPPPSRVRSGSAHPGNTRRMPCRPPAGHRKVHRNVCRSACSDVRVYASPRQHRCGSGRELPRGALQSPSVGTWARHTTSRIGQSVRPARLGSFPVAYGGGGQTPGRRGGAIVGCAAVGRSLHPAGDDHPAAISGGALRESLTIDLVRRDPDQRIRDPHVRGDGTPTISEIGS